MFKVGDLIIYSIHGICRVDDICEKIFQDVRKDYYILHPIEDNKLTISAPVDSDKINMLEIITEKEAEEVLESFKQPGIQWIDVDTIRNREYSEIVKRGNRREIVQVFNTLLKVKNNVEGNGRKFYGNDKDLFNNIQKILFGELAIALNSSFDEINKRVMNIIKAS